MRRVLLAVVLGLGAGCARAYAPPGGERDVLAPGLDSVTPAPLSVVPPSREPVVFRFNERISGRRFNRTLVTVSPAAPEDVNPEVSGRELRISLEDGWQPGRVYQILVRPGIEDLFGNRRTDPVELVFSTGDPPPPSALAGVLIDRITAQPPREAVLEATRHADSATYTAAADSVGFFALRHVPYGTYDVVAYADQNRNRRRDPGEARAGPVPATLAAGQDTVMLELVLLPNDTTPPRLVRAERIDSTHVRLSFDDFVDPDSNLEAITVQVLAPADSSALPHRARLLQVDAFEREAAARAAAADSAARAAAADSAAAAAADSARAAPPDTTGAVPVPARPPAAPRPAPALAAADTATGPPAPRKELIAELDRPLPAAEVVVRVNGVRNVNGLSGGGVGALPYQAAPPPPTETPVPADPPVPEPAEEADGPDERD